MMNGQEMQRRTLAEDFAEFIFKTDYRDIPKEVIYQAKRCILDFLGVALAGSRVGLASLLTPLIGEGEGKGEATLIGDGKKVLAIDAALINGVKGHTLDVDDGHRFANAHPGVVVVPAALAIAEKVGATGKELMEAIVAGYETLIPIGTAVNPSHLMRGFHTTGTVGPFGAAAACCKLLHLKQKEIRNALAIAGLQGAGLLEVTESGHMMKPLHAGNAARAGVIASLLAKQGAEGPDLILEGKKGFFKAFSDANEFPGVTRSLGKDFEILNVYFKMHVACRHTHAALDAVKEIMNQYVIDVKRIKKITVHTYSVAYHLTGEKKKVRTEKGAKFSLPISIGLMFIHGKVGVEECSLKSIRHPGVQKIADKTTILVDKEMDALYPSKRSARVEVETSNATYALEIGLPKGDPEDPFSDEELMAKFFHNAEKMLSVEKIKELESRIFHLEKQSIREFMRWVS